MNRMKSLFGESRHMVILDREEEIITEQFKFFDDLAAFKPALKTLIQKI